MKFIGGINTFKIENSALTVHFTHYHRSATGLLTNARVYAFPRINSLNSGEIIHELIISPFKPKNWDMIWKLEVSTIDRTGLIRDVTEVLKDDEINIFVQESLITNRDKNFTISIIGNFEHFFDDIVSSDRQTNNSQKYNSELEFLKGEGLALLTGGLTKKQDEYNKSQNVNYNFDILRFEPIRFLTDLSYKKAKPQRNQTAATDGVSNEISWDKLKDYYEKKSQAIKNKSILLKKDLVADLKLSELADDKNILQGAIFSDSEDKFIIVRFFEKKQLVAHLEIKHQNKSGAIHQFTKTICDVSQHSFNIISSYNRIEDDDQFAYWYVLLDVTKKGVELSRLIEQLRKLEVVEYVHPLQYSRSLTREYSNLPKIKTSRKRLIRYFRKLVYPMLLLSLLVINLILVFTRTEENLIFFNEYVLKALKSIWFIAGLLGGLMASIYYYVVVPEHLIKVFRKFFRE